MDKKIDDKLTPADARILLQMVDGYKIQGTLKQIESLAAMLNGIRGKLKAMIPDTPAPDAAQPTAPVKPKRKRH
jgi:hypothetical protein